MDNKAIQLEPSWLQYLQDEFNKEYMLALRSFLADQKAHKKIIYPKGELIFNALNSTTFDKVKIVVLGQDPYHGPGQAHGLSFSVPVGIPPPPSLVNIFKEIEADLNIAIPSSGYLQSWANQGVLLLNSVLTVEHKNAGSHAGQGWETFTDQIIQVLNDKRESLVFMLWGAYAQKKGQFINTQKHLVLKAPHPSPLSAHRGFLGCKHFSKANHYLEQKGVDPIEWNINEAVL